MGKLILSYIDPGTGSMLFTIIIGLAAALVYAFKGFFIKLKYLLSGGKTKAKTDDKIPYVIFTDSKRYWNVFKPICDEFERREVPLTYLTQSEDDPALKEEYKFITREFIGEGSKGFARLNILKAGTVLSTTPNIDVFQWKRSKGVDKYVHIFHDASEGTGYKMFGMDYYDAILMTGEFQADYIRKLEEMRNLPAKELTLVGSTYLDEMKKRKDSLGEKASSDKKTVLLAPSWGESAILSRFGAEIIEALVGTGYNIVVRPHPQTKISEPKILEELMSRFPDGEKVSWNFDNDNFDILSKSDIMITDFSGVISDFTCIFDKPIIYANTDFDKSTYDAAWFDGPVWRIEVLPTIGKELKKEDLGNIKEIIDEVISDDKYKEGRKNYKNTVWQCEGEAAKNVVNYLID